MKQKDEEGEEGPSEDAKHGVGGVLRLEEITEGNSVEGKLTPTPKPVSLGYATRDM